MLKAWFELLRVKLYGNDLKGNKNYFELARVQVIGSQLYKKGCVCHQPCEQQHYVCNSFVNFVILSLM